MEALNIMADKRMFSLSVVDTDWFLDLPLSTQALYFHLNLRADDDGFVDAPNSIVRKIGATSKSKSFFEAPIFLTIELGASTNPSSSALKFK